MNRADVFLVNLNTIKVSEQLGVRYCVIVSPFEMNNQLNTVIVIPLSTKIKKWSTRVNTKFKKTKGRHVVNTLELLINHD